MNLLVNAVILAIQDNKYISDNYTSVSAPCLSNTKNCYVAMDNVDGGERITINVSCDGYVLYMLVGSEYKVLNVRKYRIDQLRNMINYIASKGCFEDEFSSESTT